MNLPEHSTAEIEGPHSGHRRVSISRSHTVCAGTAIVRRSSSLGIDNLFTTTRYHSDMSTPVIADDTLPVARWTAAAHARRSRRSYGPEPINGPEAARLEEFCRAFTPFEGARTVLVAAAPPKIFTGWLLGVYGKVASPSALVFVGDRRRSEAPARAGYTGEAAVLEATALGLGTCWIGGGVRRGQVTSLLGLAPHEHVYSISALGYAPEKKSLAPLGPGRPGVGPHLTLGYEPPALALQTGR
jgi:hypothetical protein